jgi:Nif-specific regulatory protein
MHKSTTMGTDSDRTVEELRLERDIYVRLLELGSHTDPQPFVREALRLVLQMTEMRRGYLAVWSDGLVEEPTWSIAEGFSDEELVEVRRRLSSGIIARALTTGQPIRTESALDDPRFREQESVQANRISAVLCAPIGLGAPIGVVYLEDRSVASPPTDQDLSRVAHVARYIAPYVDRLLLVQRVRHAEDHTLAYRQRLNLTGIVGRSRALAEVLGQIESAARFAVPVLFSGPSGTGKTAAARAIHDNSARATKPFVELNCAAIPEGLFESELFGSVSGAHSTATKKMQGKIAVAEGGTLFLDEIGELPRTLQSKLLQFLQSKEYFPLGSARPEKANVRIIAATNEELDAAVAQKTFREDLFYRLNVLRIHVPPLEQRREDIAPLAELFLDSACRRNETPLMSIAPEALRALEEAPWPGNIRQLSHTVEVAAIRAAIQGVAVVEARHVFPEAERPDAPAGPMTFQEATRSFQKKFLLDVLNATQWNISETARRIDVTRTYVRTLIHGFGLR